MATPKTPVSILNEYMFRANNVPEYELIRSEPGLDPVFEYRVTVDHIIVTGRGRNKKDAKHAAARNALAELAKTDNLIRQQLLTNQGHASSPAVEINGDPDIALKAGFPDTEQVTENAVGALTTLCMQHELPAAEYELVGESGPPHCKNFVMHCVIRSLQLVGVGQAGTKKQAKQISAKRLIEKINEFIDSTGIDVKEIGHVSRATPTHQGKSANNTEAIRLYNSIKNKEGGIKIRENLNLVIATCHTNLQDMDGVEATALRNKNTNGNPEDILLRFAEEQRLMYAVEFTKALSKEGDEMYVCVATLNTVPELAQFGVGPTEPLAREVAAYNLLKCLIVMLD